MRIPEFRPAEMLEKLFNENLRPIHVLENVGTHMTKCEENAT